MKKGFTLVELAVVLVVIGLIMGMAVKGKELVKVAMIKKEVQKLKKIEAAFGVYYAGHESMPITGLMPTNTVITWFERDNLVNSGLITKEDLDASYMNPNHEWFILPVSYYFDGTHTIYKQMKNGNMAAAQMLEVPSTYGNKNGLILTCFIEVILDDMSAYTGEHRYSWYNIVEPVDVLAPYYEDCNSADKSLKTPSYSFRVF